MIHKLQQLANKPTRTIIGLMSGTSLDGLDIALCNVSGSGVKTLAEIKHFETIVYPEQLVNRLRNISKEDIQLRELTILHTELGKWMGQAVNKTLTKWNIFPGTVDLIASHGQTIYHAPSLHTAQQTHSTLQIGDADQIAATTGIITIADFRMKHIAAGGQGAPLAGYADYLLFANHSKDVVLVNIGGIANFTFIPSSKQNKICCSDSGPGNNLMDFWMRTQKNSRYDLNGQTAQQGNVCVPLLNKLSAHPFFNLPFPKTTGPEMFSSAWLEDIIRNEVEGELSNEDIMATLNMFTAQSIAQAIKQNTHGVNTDIYFSGGGLHNKTLMKNLKILLPGFQFCRWEEKGILPDAKEALLFALLANECVSGNPSTFTDTGLIAVSMGKISFPT